MSLKRTLPHHGPIVIGYSYVLPSAQILLEAAIFRANGCTQWFYCMEEKKKDRCEEEDKNIYYLPLQLPV